MPVYNSKYTGSQIDGHLDSVDTMDSEVTTLQTQVTTNTTDISNLKTQANTSTTNISALQTSVSANTSNIATNTSNISALQTAVSVLQSIATYESTNTGAEIDEAIDYIQTLIKYDSEPIGIRIDTSSSSPIVQRVDQNGVPFTPTSSFFETHSLWQFKRCARDRTTGLLSYGSNNRGDGLSTNGSMGDILVEIPTGGVKWWYSSPYLYIIVCPYDNMPTGFTTCPAAYQRGAVAHSKIYVGAFEASIRTLSGTRRLTSVAGVQPITGGGYKYVAFTAGTDALVAGATVTGATSGATAIIADVNITSGTSGSYVGTLYIRQLVASNGTSAGAFNSTGENLTISGTTCAAIASDATSISLPITTAESYGNNIGTGFGICNIHTYDWINLLMLIEFGTFNIQNTLARGIVDYTNTAIYSGRLTEADAIYSNNIHSYMSINGTGVGSGVAGKTPFWYRGLENYCYGNVTEFAIGFNADSSTGVYHILNRLGVASPVIEGILSSGNYETGATAVEIIHDAFTGGYISAIKTDEVSVLSMIPSASLGSSSTYLCDYYTPPSNANSILLVGGNWSKGSMAGICYKSMSPGSADSLLTTGCRIEYIPQD